jgi:hypothetical protein
MSQLHGCAKRLWKLLGSALRPGTWAQGVARASGPEPEVAGHRQSGVPRSAPSAWVMRAPKWRLKETRGNRGEWLRSIRPKRATIRSEGTGCRWIVAVRCRYGWPRRRFRVVGRPTAAILGRVRTGRAGGRDQRRRGRCDADDPQDGSRELLARQDPVARDAQRVPLDPQEVGEVADALAKFGADPIIRF